MKYSRTLLLVCITIALLSACKNEELSDQASESTFVTIIHPKTQKTSFPIRTSGKLASKSEMKLSFKTGGLINYLPVNEGDYIKKGELLAKLNTSEVEAQVRQARLGLEKSQRDLKRAENLYADSVATLEQLENAQTAVELAEAQLNIAEFNLKYSSIHAPANGKILHKLAEPNEIIAPGHPVFLFGSLQSAWVLRVNLSDVQVVRINEGDKAAISFDAFPQKKINATVSEITSSSDPYTGTYEVELKILSDELKLVSGLIGKAEIIPSASHEYKTLPIAAIHEAVSNQGIVYVAHGTAFERRKVDILQLTDSLIYVNGTLSPTDSVILDGAPYLISGTPIKITD